jgi:hypothetical protein
MSDKVIIRLKYIDYFLLFLKIGLQKSEVTVMWSPAQQRRECVAQDTSRSKRCDARETAKSRRAAKASLRKISFEALAAGWSARQIADAHQERHRPGGGGSNHYASAERGAPPLSSACPNSPKFVHERNRPGRRIAAIARALTVPCYPRRQRGRPRKSEERRPNPLRATSANRIRRWRGRPVSSCDSPRSPVRRNRAASSPMWKAREQSP